MSKKPAKPRPNPMAKRMADLESVNLQPDAATLARQADIQITRAGQSRAHATDDKKASHDTARRLDAFAALAAGMAQGCYDAARRFEADLLARHGCTDGGAGMERVDCERGRSDHMLLAGARVDEIRDRIPPRDYWLLCELIVPPIDRGGWRDHVQYVCGEKHTEAQAACVRAATVNLRDAYRAIERRAAA